MTVSNHISKAISVVFRVSNPPMGDRLVVAVRLIVSEDTADLTF